MKRALLLTTIAIIAFFAAGVFSAGRACAHDPRFACSPRDAAHPIAVSDPQKSWAFYGRLAANAEDRYTMVAAHPTRVPVQLLIDQRDAANPLRPVAVVADGSGRVIARADLTHERRFFEPFSRVTYAAGVEQRVLLPAGESTITVRMHGTGVSQRYTLALGAEERFSIVEIPYVVGAVYRIHERRF